MSIFDLLNRVTDVVNIAGQVVDVLGLGEDNNVNDNYSKVVFGPLSLEYVFSDLFLQNNSDQALSLTYNLTQPDGGYVGVTQPLSANSGYSCNLDFKQFLNGQISLCPSEKTESGVTAGGTRFISFMIKTVKCGVPIYLASNISINFNVNGTYRFLVPDNIVNFDFTFSFADSMHSKATVQDKYKKSSNSEDEPVYQIPKNLVIDAEVIYELSGMLELPAESYNAITADRMKLVKSIDEISSKH